MATAATNYDQVFHITAVMIEAIHFAKCCNTKFVRSNSILEFHTVIVAKESRLFLEMLYLLRSTAACLTIAEFEIASRIKAFAHVLELELSVESEVGFRRMRKCTRKVEIMIDVLKTKRKEKFFSWREKSTQGTFEQHSATLLSMWLRTATLHLWHTSQHAISYIQKQHRWLSFLTKMCGWCRHLRINWVVIG